MAIYKPTRRHATQREKFDAHSDDGEENRIGFRDRLSGVTQLRAAT